REGRASLAVETPAVRSVTLGADVVMARGAAVRLASDGLQVFSVEGGSALAAADLQAGDLIRAVDGAPVSSLSDLASALEGDRSHTLSVLRGGESVEITLP
ncbi:MAG: PDZ domain-containing protein, partial [Alphaproteobacteria bacterium]|nr:PDZ domain-containing protein [Alphaproteobacteria bacterium]